MAHILCMPASGALILINRPRDETSRAMASTKADGRKS